MAKTCYICGARTKHPANLTCGFEPCKVEHLRRHPEARKPKAKMPAFGVDRGHMRKPLLYDSKLQVQCVALLACLALSACGTVAPKAVEARQPSFSQTPAGESVQDSGIVWSDEFGYHVRQDYMDRYLSMLPQFGPTLSPPRKPGNVDGITAELPSRWEYAQGARWVFSVPARDAFAKMNALRKVEDAP